MKFKLVLPVKEHSFEKLIKILLSMSKDSGEQLSQIRHCGLFLFLF